MSSKLLLLGSLLLYLRKFVACWHNIQMVRNNIRTVKAMDIKSVSEIIATLQNKLNKTALYCFVQGYISASQPIPSMLNNMTKLVYRLIYKSFKYSSSPKQIRDTLNISNMINDTLFKSYAKQITLSDLVNTDSAKLSILSSTSIQQALTEIGVKQQLLTPTWAGKIKNILSKLFRYIVPFEGVFKGAKIAELVNQIGIKNNDYVTVLGRAYLNNNKLQIVAKTILKQKSDYISHLYEELNMLKREMYYRICILLFFLYVFKPYITRYSLKLYNYLRVEFNSFRPQQQSSESESIQMENPQMNCFVCYSSVRNIIFKPCKHFGVCKKCWQTLESNMCPICKHNIEGVIEVKKIKNYIFD